MSSPLPSFSVFTSNYDVGQIYIGNLLNGNTQVEQRQVDAMEATNLNVVRLDKYIAEE